MISTPKLYQVGGSVRDELLGVPCKDYDYAVEAESFTIMYEALLMMGVEVYLAKPEFLTLRGKWQGKSADFVLARKDGSYYDGRHPDTVEPGTIYDDLSRRDFTVNAMAKDIQTGLILDPHNGMIDLRGKVLRTVGTAQARFSEDGLRMLRALRFAITKGMTLDMNIVECLTHRSFWEPRLGGVSVERIREELFKMFHFDTRKTLNMLDVYRGLRSYLFQKDALWLKPTLEGK